MMLSIESVEKLNVSVLPCVSFLAVNGPMIGACAAYAQLCRENGIVGVVTGASRERVYRKEPLHLMGLAWDFRSYIFPKPYDAFVRLVVLLSEIDPAYRAVHIKAPKPDHFHVEYRRGPV